MINLLKFLPSKINKLKTSVFKNCLVFIFIYTVKTKKLIIGVILSISHLIIIMQKIFFIK